MEPFATLDAVAAPLILDNIDTDQIIPGKDLMKVQTSGFAAGLFSEWRYVDGTTRENPGFVLNREPYRRAGILLAGANFACGSSREVAVWALRDFGIRCVIAPSYGGIFFANCFRNGVLPVVLPPSHIALLVAGIEAGDPVLRVDLPAQEVRQAAHCFRFDISPLDKAMLLQGLDAVELTLARSAEIDAYQTRDRVKRPWIYLSSEGDSLP